MALVGPCLECGRHGSSPLSSTFTAITTSCCNRAVQQRTLSLCASVLARFDMPTERLFLDIRYYESDRENVVGSSLPNGPGRIFTLPRSIHALGARIARKLREFGFVAGAYDHLYVNFTTVLPE